MAQLAVDGGAKTREAGWPGRRQFGDEEIQQVTEALRSQNLFAPSGTKCKQFCDEFAKAIGAGHAVMSSSGTAAVHLAVGALDLEPGSEVILSPVSDMGSVIGVIAQGCVPVFADWAPGTQNVDPLDVVAKLNDRTAAVIVVHLMGHPVDLGPILEACAARGVPVIEDCAQAYLATLGGRNVGTIGSIGCFSLQQSKHIAAGEGGINVCDDADLAAELMLYGDKGWDRLRPGSRVYPGFGFNYRPSELTGAVALAQLTKLHRVVARRQSLADQLSALIADVPGVQPPALPASATASHWYYTLHIGGHDPVAFGRAVAAEGVPLSVGYTGKPIYQCSEVFRSHRTFGQSSYPFRGAYTGDRADYHEGLCPVVERELGQMALLPLHEECGEQEVRDAAAAIRKVAEGLG